MNGGVEGRAGNLCSRRKQRIVSPELMFRSGSVGSWVCGCRKPDQGQGLSAQVLSRGREWWTTEVPGQKSSAFRSFSCWIATNPAG